MNDLVPIRVPKTLRDAIDCDVHDNTKIIWVPKNDPRVPKYDFDGYLQGYVWKTRREVPRVGDNELNMSGEFVPKHESAEPKGFVRIRVPRLLSDAIDIGDDPDYKMILVAEDDPRVQK